MRRYDESTRKALEEIVSALGGWDSHSAFDLDEHREHRDAVERGREKHPGIDSLTLMVDARYAAIEKALNESGFPRQREHETTVSDKIDRVLTHRVFAFPIFFAVLALMLDVYKRQVPTFARAQRQAVSLRRFAGRGGRQDPDRRCRLHRRTA